MSDRFLSGTDIELTWFGDRSCSLSVINELNSTISEGYLKYGSTLGRDLVLQPLTRWSHDCASKGKEAREVGRELG